MLRVLLVEEANHVVEMWEGSGASWKMTRSASPGRLAAFEEELFRGVGASAAATIDDAAAQRALNVFPSRLDTSATFSLYGLMARGRTAMGKRRLRAWLKQPLVDPAEITSRLNVVEALVSDAELREKLRDQHMRGLPDVERLVRKLDSRRAGSAIGLGELCQLYRVSARLPLIEDALRQHEGPHAQMLQERYCDELAVAHDQDHLCKFEELVEAAVDLDRVPDEYLIAPAYREDLQRLHDEKEELEREVEQCAAAAAKDLELVLDKTVKLEWHKFQNMRTRCLRITQKEEKRVRSKLSNGMKYRTIEAHEDGTELTHKGCTICCRYRTIEARKDGTELTHKGCTMYRTIEARKDGIKFTSKQLERAAALLQDNSAKYEDLQKELVEQVVDVARSFVEVWEGVTSLLSELDVLAGFADLAANAPDPYARPEVGACVLMAQVGCFVPCTSARICVRDAIFARVGAGDCQQRGVSTFMAEMLETGAILKGATKNSLVIIDELGRGTSTYDGFGLAWAISEHLMETTQAPTLFATHFHELTEITGPTGVRNLHVSTVVDPTSGRLTMLYQIKDGACDQSFGIQVAESAGFPASVVQLAREKLAQLEGAEIISVKGSLEMLTLGHRAAVLLKRRQNNRSWPPPRA
ncbi:muts domain V-domain-containing protein [Dunaliella salina]|uniref:Muts domain V-domain-containing protein n=1 Tax=Dunaliella salina TaxID=3046 RepID=A0ABQ7GIG6_DUNSA|nr:muts domain V-domain-containing protein [Dunaliella salina]|eukprot:KAF5834359.1 muts domain V-domain-containing protein [Dunaliella salina]